MDRDQAATLMTKALKGFHGKFKAMYGQLCVRVDSNTFLSTGGNKILAEITEDSYELCVIDSGDLGEIFTKRSDINAILFGCSADAVAVSEKADAIPVTLEDLARLTGSELKVIPDASASSILAALKDTSVCLIKGTGAIAVGSNSRKAVAGIQIVEKACEAEVHGEILGGTVPLEKALADDLRKDFLSDYINRNEEPYAEYVKYNEEEFAIRGSLIDHGKELVKRDLSYGSWGNLSVRLNDDEMLITPSSMDYFDIKIEDIVKVNIHTLEYGNQRIPSTEVRMHAAAYRNLPDCKAIIQTRSNAISVFAACRAGFALGGGELQELIGDVKVTEYAPPGSEELCEAVVSTFSNTHACIIPHHGAVFYGPSLDVVLAIAEAVEMKARNLLSFDSGI
ncbi:MAG: class II aldolase/adducin family protein [Mogibacterium sp.]|nr:class II aldolase/adducin family protein [Mogibacterium sp.]